VGHDGPEGARVSRRKRKAKRPGLRWLPPAARKWIDGSGAIELIDRQHALYVNLGLGEENVLLTYRERAMQKAVIQYVGRCYPGIGSLCFHVPLELLRRDDHTAGMFNALGARAGVADVVMLVARGAYHGLVIELKVPPRRPTESQCNFLEAARREGYAACWSDSLNTVLKLIDVYLTLPARATLAELQPPSLEEFHELRRSTKARRKAHRPDSSPVVPADDAGAT
jgi:hypothetical protein